MPPLRRSFRRPAAAAAFAAAVLVAARPAGAQATRGLGPAELATDSVAWQRVLVHVVGALSTQLVQAAADPRAQPWDVRLPPGEPQRDALAAQLRTLLRARAPAPGDPVVYALALGPLEVAGDTARVELRFSEERRCPGSAATTGFSVIETVLVPRHPTERWWGAAFSRAATGGDRAGCPGRRD